VLAFYHVAYIVNEIHAHIVGTDSANIIKIRAEKEEGESGKRCQHGRLFFKEILNAQH